ncbi:MAG: hypothetical protein H6Q10_3470 [Acidobacteria bacterium]|nr:hypothetical protein [Acidobacteriota bacterium]
MTGTKRLLALAAGFAIACGGAAAAGQQRPYRVSDQQLQDLVNRLDTHRDAFRGSFERAIDRSPIKGSEAADEMGRSVKSLDQALSLLRDRVNDRHSDTADAEDVLRRASVIDDFMMRNQLDTAAHRDWEALRPDMDDLARAYGIARSWRAVSQNVPDRVDDKQAEQLLKQIREKAGRFDNSLDRAFDHSGIDDRRGKDAIRQAVKDLGQAADRLRDRVKGRQSNALDAEEVLRRGAGIEGFMQRYQLGAEAEQGWLSLRGDLDRLARAYHVAWNWSDPGYAPAVPGAGFHHRLTGTYQLEANGSDDPRRVAERAARAAPSDQRQRTYENLLARLQAPDLIAIERNENSVTMASTRGRLVTVDADGRDHLERWSADRTMTTRATLEGERLVVATSGNPGRDYTATFDPMENGRGLQVTRTIDHESLRQGVTARSSYRRVSDDARWNLDPGGPRGPGDDAGLPMGDFVVPDGTRFVALLDTALSTTNAREGDPYTMTTRSPSQYAGAVIQGVVSAVNESGRLTGRAGMSLSLQSIRLPSGGSYQFDGVIEDIRAPGGERVRVDRDGTFDTDGSQTQRTVERGAIGAALGAIIGVIAGGGKGAAIGAVIGAGGGAGTVIVEGRDRLDLQRGTEVTITSGAPSNLGAPPGAQR